MSIIVPGIPGTINELVQERTLERVFHDALTPRQLFRLEATPELWQANLGEQMIFTRAGLMVPATAPLVPGTDPVPQGYSTEQWSAFASQYGSSIDTLMPTNYVTLAPLFARNTLNLGVQAGMSLDRTARNRLFLAYLGGESTVRTAGVSGSTQLTVNSLSGFTEILVNGRLVPVSPSAPLPVTFSAVGEPANSVVGVAPLDPAVPNGPGVLTLSAALTTNVTLRSAVYASTRARRLRIGGGATVDNISTSNILTLNDIISAVSRLRDLNVGPHTDGRYHVHLSPLAEAQIFRDDHWQRLHQSLPESYPYRELAIGEAVGCVFFRNTEAPSQQNCGGLQSLPGTTGGAILSADIGAEVTNDAGLPIRRTIVTGGGVMYEKYLDESKYITEAGVQGKIGEFSVVSNSIQIMTNRIRYIIRSPQDALQQMVRQSWSWSGDFPIPSDATTGDAARYKRAVVIEGA